MDRRRFSRDTRGVAATEFALLLPILVVLAFGIIELSLVLYNKAMITNASRVGARSAIAGGTNVNQLVKDYCNTHLINLGGVKNTIADGDIVIASVTLPGTKNAISVQVNYTNNYLFAALIGLQSPSINLSSSTVMRLE